MDATTEPEQADKAFRGPKHVERARLQAHINEFLAAGGEIEYVPSDLEREVANPVDPLREKSERGTQRAYGGFRREQLGKNKQQILAAVEANPGATAPEVAERVGWGEQYVRVALGEMEGTGVRSTYINRKDTAGRNRNYKSWYPR